MEVRKMEIKFETQRDFETAVNDALCVDADIFQNIRDQFSELEKKIVFLEKRVVLLNLRS
jgi:hypothetical protein